MFIWIPASFTYNLGSADVAYLGQPFIQGPANNAINLQLEDTAYLGQPFCAYWKY